MKYFAKYKILNTKYFKKGISLLLVLLVIGGISLKYFAPSSEAAWFDDSFAYRTPISFTNSGSQVTYQKVKFDVDTATLISAGKMQSDCGDSRFTNANGKVLRYYLDSAGGACNTSSTDYYVLLPVIPVGGNVVYHYYGNPNAANGTEIAQFSETTFSQTPSTGSEEKGPAPVAYWSFDEGSGATVKDNTVNSNTGTLTDGTWKTEDQCIKGKCLYFDGTNDGAGITGTESQFDFERTDSFSASLWIKPQVTRSGGETVRYLVSKLDSNSPYHGWEFGTDWNAGATPSKTVMLAHLNGTGGSIVLLGSTDLQNDTWYHLTYTYDGSSSVSGVKMYINGKLETSTTTVSNSLSGTMLTDIIPRIGNRNNAAAYWKGYIDEVKVYKYTRTAAQILADYNSVAGDGGNVLGASNQKFLSDGLIGYWKMDESSGDASDSSGNSFTLTNNSTTSYGTGKFGSAGSFVAASTDYFSTATTISGVKTVAFWVNPSSTTDEFINLTSSAYITASSGTVSATGFTSPRIYVNGVLNGTISASVWNYVVVVSDTATNANAFEVGRANSAYTDGSIDDVRIYNRAFSGNEVSSLYTWGPGAIGYWGFDEGRGSSVSDKSGNGTTLSFNGNASWARGKIGYAMKMPASPAGNSSGATVSNPSALNLTIQNITLSAWVYYQSGNQYNNPATIVGKFNCCGSSAYKLYVDPSSSDKVSISVTDNSGAGNDTYTVTTSTGIPRNTWVHVEGVFDRTNSTSSKIFFNGIDQSVTRTGTITVIGSVSDTTPLYVGYQYYEFGGMIDEVKVYNYARTASQVIEDANGSHPVVAGARTGGLAAYWKMSDGYSTTINDSSGNGNKGTLTNMANPPTTTSGLTNSGKYGRGLNFDGTNDYMSVANSSSLNITNAITFSAWVYSRSIPASNSYSFIGKKSDGSNHQYALLLDGPDCSGTRFTFVVWIGASAKSVCAANTSPQANTWYHVTGTYDGSYIRIYINGKLDSSTAQTGSIDTATGTFKIGTNISDLYWNGIIDEVKLYSVALSSSDIALEANQASSQVLGSSGTDTSGNNTFSLERAFCPPGDSGNSACGPIAEWSFEEKQGSTVYDTSGNGRDGTWNGTGTNRWVTGKIGSAGRFNGSDDYISLSGSFMPTGATARSVSFWVKTASPATRQGILYSGTESSYRRYYLEIESSTFVVNYYAAALASNTTVVANTWYHVETTYDGSVIRLYVNGVLENSASVPLNTGSTSNVIIGSFGASNLPLNGQIDQLRIFQYARSAAEVAWDYNRGAPISYYKLDECQGSPIHDSGTNRLDGVLDLGANGTQTSIGTCQTSSTAWGNGATGKVNSSLNFDGTTDNVAISGSPLSNTSNFTIAAWIKPSSLNQLGTIFYNKTNGVALVIGANNTSEATGSYLRGLFEGVAWIPTSYSFASTSTWYHVVMTRDGTTTRFYVDGKTISTTSTATPSYGGASSSWIGATNNSGGRPFNGQIDEVQVFPYALNATQIKTLYNGGAVRFGPITGTP